MTHMNGSDGMMMVRCPTVVNEHLTARPDNASIMDEGSVVVGDELGSGIERYGFAGRWRGSGVRAGAVCGAS